MKSKIVITLMLLIALFALTSCTKPVPDEERIKSDVVLFAPEWDDDSEITSLEIIRRDTDEKNKRDTVRIKVKAESDEIACVKRYKIDYVYNSDAGWSVSEMEADRREEWEFSPLSGASKSVIQAYVNENYIECEGSWYINQFETNTLEITSRETDLNNKTDAVTVSLDLANPDGFTFKTTALVSLHFDDEQWVADSYKQLSVNPGGKCGDSLYWFIEDDGTLKISGEGAMWDFDRYGNPQWLDYYDWFTGVSFEEGITHIGEKAFTEMTSLKGDLIIPNSVTSIGAYAFQECEGLDGKLTLSENLETIGKSAFVCCSSLNGPLVIPDKVTSIGASAFDTCCAFIDSKVIIPSSVKEIGSYAFMFMVGLDMGTDIYFYGDAPSMGDYVFDTESVLYHIPDTQGWGDSGTYNGYVLKYWMPDEMLNALKETATAGDADAQYQLFVLYFMGQAVEQDVKEAFNWCKMSAEHGKAKACGMVGYLYEYGYGTEESLEEAIKWYEKGADLNDDESLCSLAEFYFNGYGVQKDDTKGFELSYKAAELGNARAMRFLGTSYYFGDGTEADINKAVEWYKKAADSGDDIAMYNLGCCYSSGTGVTQSSKKAFELFLEAAKAGNVDGQREVGKNYYYGEDVSLDYSKALEWFRKAAEQGDIISILHIGECYEFGYGVYSDSKEAFSWFSKAAELGSDLGTYMIGLHYYYGDGVSKDKAKGVEYIKKASEMGLATATEWLKKNT